MTSPFLWRQGRSETIQAINPNPKARTNPGNRGLARRPIEQLSITGEVLCTYPSISEAARSSGVPNPNIVRVASGVRNTAGGYRWRYVEKVAA